MDWDFLLVPYPLFIGLSITSRSGLRGYLTATLIEVRTRSGKVSLGARIEATNECNPVWTRDRVDSTVCCGRAWGGVEGHLVGDFGYNNIDETGGTGGHCTRCRIIRMSDASMSWSFLTWKCNFSVTHTHTHTYTHTHMHTHTHTHTRTPTHTPTHAHTHTQTHTQTHTLTHTHTHTHN